MGKQNARGRWTANWIMLAVCVLLLGGASPATAQAPEGRVPSEHEQARPRVTRYVEGDPIPEGAQLRTRRHRGRWVTGLIILGSSYVVGGAVSTFMSARYGGNVDGRVWVPFVGPLLYSLDEFNSGRGAGVGPLVFQTLGLIVLLRGLLSEQQVLVFEPIEGASVRVDAVPLDGGGLVSLTLFEAPQGSQR